MVYQSVVPLTPLQTIWFDSQLETDLLKEQKNSKIYCRYVGDLFCIFQNKSKTQQINGKFIKMHNDIKLLIQTSQENKQPYLDTQVQIKDNKIFTTIYRKPTRTKL